MNLISSMKETIDSLKKDEKRVYRYDFQDKKYGILILDRGELLFVQENERALICEISARHSLISMSSIKKWDDGNKIENHEKEHLLDIICSLYEKSYKDKLGIHP